MSVAVEFENISRRFGAVTAVDRIDLGIEEGSFFAMLGPSGSGKTTCLRLISGFDRPSDGHIRIFGEDSNDIPPNRRPVNTVFQDYALFPHLDVNGNVAYGLMVRGAPKAERIMEAAAMLDLVKLGGYGKRKPSQLSGGQRQRVALARALINRPRVLLLDEPLGALDLKLREQMQEELKSIQKTLGITFIFVTHDQGEALSMADRIAVLNEGRVIQAGTPQVDLQAPAHTLRGGLRRLVECAPAAEECRQRRHQGMVERSTRDGHPCRRRGRAHGGAGAVSSLSWRHQACHGGRTGPRDRCRGRRGPAGAGAR